MIGSYKEERMEVGEMRKKGSKEGGVREGSKIFLNIIFILFLLFFLIVIFLFCL